MSADLVAAFLDALLRASWQATVLVAVVLLLQRLLRRWLTPRWRHALWLIVVARLLLPLAPASTWSAFNLAPTLPLRLTARPATAGQTPVSSDSSTPAALPPFMPTAAWADRPPGKGPSAIRRLTIGDSSAALRTAGTEAPDASPARRATTPVANPGIPVWHWLVFALWVLGVLFLSARLLRGWLRFRRELHVARLLDAAVWSGLLAECRQRLHVRGNLRAFEADWVHSPALCGWWRPRLLLPTGLAERLSQAGLRHVLLHELAHLKRHDILVNWIATAAQVLHWFNPVVWFAMRRLRAERELAADHLALVALGEDSAQSYGETILRLMAGLARPAAVPAMVCILEDRGALRERIRAVAAFRRPGRWSGLAVVLVVALAIVGLTDAVGEKNGTPASVGLGGAPAAQTNTRANTSHSQEDLLWGTVFLDGHPLEGASVAYYDHIRRMGGAGVTDAQGRIFVYPNPQARKLVVWFDPFQAALDTTRITNEFRVELGSARGRVTGTLWRGDEAWPTKALTLERRWPGLIEPGYSPVNRTNRAFRMPTITDVQGRFEFRDVPCGVWVVRSRHVEWGEFAVKPGAVLSTVLGRGGAAIVGQVVQDDATLNPDWRTAYVYLITNAGGSPRWLPGEVEADGSFVVPNVPPGDHELMVVLESAAVIRQNQFPVELGATPRVPVSVPDETVARPCAISVGTVTLRMRPPRETAQPSREAAESSMTEGRMVITVEAQPPHYYLRNQPVTLEQLQAELGAQAAINRDLSVAVRVQTNSPIGILLKAMDAVKAAGFRKPASVFTSAW